MTSFNSPLEAFLYWEAKLPDRIFLTQPANSKLYTYTFKEVGDEVRAMASKLKSYNLPRRSHIALFSKNCAHWIMSDLAIAMSDNVSVPLYPTLNATSINQILVHSDSKAIIIGKLDDYESQKSGVPDIHKISIGLYGENEGELWEDILETQVSVIETPHVNENDLHTIIYTSGTTGNPKGVMHTLRNFMISADTFTEALKFPENMEMFSYLPLAHVAERLIAVTGIVNGASISFTESLTTFASDLERTQPHVFFAVPRIWTKFQEKIVSSISQKKLNIILNIPFLNTIFIKKMKYKLGLSRAGYVCSAAAPIPSSLIHWYRKLDIKIYQGYGMTEDCCVSHFSLPNMDRIGSVGKALNGVSTKLSAEGEICIKNTCLMKGYYKEPEMTAQVFDEEGYLKTGDVGEYDHDGYLTITGRVKDQFKTDKGKYISPAPIELQLSKNKDIDQICIVGTGIPQPIALITLSELGSLKSKGALSNGLIEIVNQINPDLEKHERIEKVVVMKEDWNVDNGLTTPTLKIKRNSVEKIHRKFYKSWFEMTDKVIFE